MDILDQGAREANKQAEETLKLLKENVGILRKNLWVEFNKLNLICLYYSKIVII